MQLGAWSANAIAEHKNVRQTDENEILNLVDDGAITGPSGKPGFASYGSVFAVNCPPVAYVDQPPTKDKAENAFNR